MGLINYDVAELVALCVALLALPAAVLGISVAIENGFAIIATALRGYEDDL